MGKLGLVLMGRIMLSKSLIHFSVDGRGCVSSLFVGLRPNNPDNHNGMIIYLKPDILESEVKWVLGNITRNKASGCDGIPVKLFEILKDNAVKVLHSIYQQVKYHTIALILKKKS